MKATLLVGFVVLANGILLLSALLSGLDYNVSHLAGQLSAKVLLVITQLALWGANYWLFWRGGRLPALLQRFEENTVSFDRKLARVLTGLFFLLPVVLFVFNAIRGAHAVRG